MECPRCGTSVSDLRSRCGTCGFNVRAKGASTPGAVRATGAASDPADWTTAGDGLRWYALGEVVELVGIALFVLLVFANIVTSESGMGLSLAAIMVTSGVLRVLGLHRFRRLPYESGGADMALRAFWAGVIAAGCKVGLGLVMAAAVEGAASSAVETLQSPLRWGSSIGEIASLVSVLGAIAAYAQIHGDEPARKLMSWVRIGFVVMIVVSVILGVVTHMSTDFYLVFAVLYVGWTASFCFALLRGRRLALAIAATQASARSF